MRAGNTKFATLATRDLQAVQFSHIKSRFELAENSALGQTVVQLVNEALASYEEAEGQVRAEPGQMLVEHQGTRLLLPVLDPAWVARLNVDLGLRAVRQHHECEQFTILSAEDPQATFTTLWNLLGRHEVAKRAPKGYDFLPQQPQEHAASGQGRQPQDAPSVPAEVLQPVLQTLVDQYGCRPAQAEAMIKATAGIRAWCCPRLEELQPGQVVWFANSTRKSRRRDPRLLRPVVLTLVGPGENHIELQHQGEYKALRIRQMERMTTEAWKQDAVLTNTDVEWLTGMAPTMVRHLLETYQERFGIILPTAGTVLDMGRTLTHKKLVVELALQGFTTREIGRKIYHTEEAVDAYLKSFDKLLLLRYHGLPVSAMLRLLECSRSLLDEYIELAEQHLPGDESMRNYLSARGIPLENTS